MSPPLYSPSPSSPTSFCLCYSSFSFSSSSSSSSSSFPLFFLLSFPSLSLLLLSLSFSLFSSSLFIHAGLDVVVEAGDRESMMQAMRNVRDVRRRTPQISSMLEPLRSIVFLLKVRGKKSLSECEIRIEWDNLG